MSFFSIFGGNDDIKDDSLPWYNLPSVFEYIKANLDSDGNLSKEGNKLPDEERRYENEKVRWIAGGLDGTLSYHAQSGNSAKDTKKVVELVKAISQKNSLSKKVELYNLLLKDNLMEFIDPSLEKIAALNLSIKPYLTEYARWLAFKGADRGPVKFGIALLGFIGDKSAIDKLITIGKHEEFTLFSVVALTNIYEDPEMELWELARHVEGWGKIHIVQRLGKTQNSKIKKWLIREGYKNGIMYEYLAYTCAVGGDLRGELRAEVVDDELLNAAGEIIEALINGGPAEDLDLYEDGAEVVMLYVQHMEKKANQTLADFLVLQSIKRYMEDENADWKERETIGWTEDLKVNLLIDIHKMINDIKWGQMIKTKIDTRDPREMWQVDQAAEFLGIDMWDIHLNRLTESPTQSEHWYKIMQSANNDNIDKIITLALEQLPLDEIATGPADELGLGGEFELHSCLDYLLQRLGAFPNKGFPLIKAALRSPVTRNRNFAIKALSAWGASNWPEGTKSLLVSAEKVEPNESTKTDLRNLLNGKDID